MRDGIVQIQGWTFGQRLIRRIAMFYVCRPHTKVPEWGPWHWAAEPPAANIKISSLRRAPLR